MAELGDVNISSIEEYKSVSKRYEFMTAQGKRYFYSYEGAQVNYYQYGAQL